MSRSTRMGVGALLSLLLLSGCLQAERTEYRVQVDASSCVRAEKTYYNVSGSDTSGTGLVTSFSELLEEWRGESRPRWYALTWSIFCKSRRLTVEGGVLVARESLFCDEAGTLFATGQRADARWIPNGRGVDLMGQGETGLWAKGDILSANVAVERRGGYNLIWWPDSIPELRVVFGGEPPDARSSADLLARFLAWRRAHPEVDSTGGVRDVPRRAPRAAGAARGS